MSGRRQYCRVFLQEKIVTALRDPTETPKASWGWGMGKAIPQPNSESGERHKLPQRGSGLSGNDFGDF